MCKINKHIVKFLLSFLNQTDLELVILCCGVCPEHRRMLSSISGLYPPDASRKNPHHHHCDNKKSPQTQQSVPWGQTDLLRKPWAR